MPGVTLGTMRLQDQGKPQTTADATISLEIPFYFQAVSNLLITNKALLAEAHTHGVSHLCSPAHVPQHQCSNTVLGWVAPGWVRDMINSLFCYSPFSRL